MAQVPDPRVVEHTFTGGGTRLARLTVRPVARFLRIEAAGGILLLIATIAALVWANSPWKASYDTLWHTEFLLEIGSFHLEEDLLHVVNDALMAIFFFVVGIEIKREMVTGGLRDPRKAALPVIAALGGMIVPAALFIAINLGGDGAHGWGIPMATDIAFALGVVALLGPRVPSALKLFLLTLAVVDDIGAILVIAIFYTRELSLGWLLIGIGTLVLIYIARRMRIWYFPVYVVLGSFAWLAIFESGVHATIAGVALGLLTPAVPLREPRDAVRDAEARDAMEAGDVPAAVFLLRESLPVTARLEYLLHPWTSYVIIPIFALANAGIELSSDSVADAAGSRVTLGVIVGLLVGKFVGVGGFALISTKLGFTSLPEGVKPAHMIGVSLVAGIGFTVSTFIAGLAYEEVALQDEAKIGILVVSFLAAAVGAGVLYFAGKEPSEA